MRAAQSSRCEPESPPPLPPRPSTTGGADSTGAPVGADEEGALLGVVVEGAGEDDVAVEVAGEDCVRLGALVVDAGGVEDLVV